MQRTRRLALLFVALTVAASALALQRIGIHSAERLKQDSLLQKRANALRSLKAGEKRDFRGQFYPHSSGSHGERSAEYGVGVQANAFLTYQKPLRIGPSLQVLFPDLHYCPEGLGACSYSGMIEIIVDNDSSIVVDVFGIGSDDANWFSVRDGTLVTPEVAAAMSQAATNDGILQITSVSQEEFHRCIKQCWQARDCTRSRNEGHPSPREIALREFGGRVLQAICFAWAERSSDYHAGA